MGKIKIGVFACFSVQIQQLSSCAGGLCWPIGVTTALLGRLLPSDGYKLAKKKERKFGPKSAPGRPLFDRPSYFKFVW
jgi:hypothetical protein